MLCLFFKRKFLVLVACSALTSNAALAQDNGCSVLEGCNSCDRVEQIFSPCQVCCGTLFQWSCTTTCTGGPDLDAPLVTDRPDFTEASSTVGKGVAQLEIGYTFTREDDATHSHSFPESLLRYGIMQDWLELRVAWTDNLQETNGRQVSGTDDLYLGFKIGLTPQQGILPEMALIPQMTIPTGAARFTASDAMPGANWIYGWEINDFVSTAGSTQFNRSVDDGSGENYTEWAQSWTVAYSLCDQIGAYTEWFALIPHSADTAMTEHYVNGGFTYLLTNDIQWDVRIGTGLNAAADDYFIGTGLSLRYY
ncbi:MAG: transporter [Fuerstiella sp.]|nr:transporter [Fuerstiella sp.]